MRKITSLVAAMLLSVATFAQAPQGFSYQAVVRDAQNAIVANQTVEVTVTILQGAAFESAKAVFSEKHSAKTNANGLFTLTIGSVDAAGFAKINWGNGSCFLKTESAYGESTTQLMSVPYALYAANAGTVDKATIEQFVSNIDFTTYNLVNKSTLANYTTAQKLKDTLAVYAKTADLPEGVNLTGYAKTDDLAKVATTGSYNDLTNKPTIPTTVSQLTDAGNYLTTSTAASTYATQSSLVTVATALNDLAERTTIPMINVTVKMYEAATANHSATGTTIKLFDMVFESKGTKPEPIEKVYKMPAYSVIFLNIKKDADDGFLIKVNDESYYSGWQDYYTENNGFGTGSDENLNDRMYLLFKNGNLTNQKWIFALPGEDCTIEISINGPTS
jgi:hypothetical protein